MVLIVWAVCASATPVTRVDVSAGLEPMPAVLTSFETTIGDGFAVHAGFGGIYVGVLQYISVVDVEANVGLRFSFPGERVRPDFGVRLGAGWSGLASVGTWTQVHVDALAGLRIGGDTALDLRAGPMAVMGWRRINRPLPGFVCQAGVSVRFGPDPLDYVAGGTRIADEFQLVADERGTDPVAVADQEIAARRAALVIARARAHSNRDPEVLVARDQALVALYDAIEARDQLRAARRSRPTP